MREDGVSANERRLLTVLVAEDEVLIRMIVSDGLRDAGFSVIEAMNGDEAVEILNSGAPVDLVFSDVRMPGSLDGLGLLAFVRRTFPDLPVVITSGHLPPELAFADGAMGFVAKPYEVGLVIKAVEDTIAKCP